MFIQKLTWRRRNDFHFVAMCRGCGKITAWGDGYADEDYHARVFPTRHCPALRVNEFGEKRSDEAA